MLTPFSTYLASQPGATIRLMLLIFFAGGRGIAGDMLR